MSFVSSMAGSVVPKFNPALVSKGVLTAIDPSAYSTEVCNISDTQVLLAYTGNGCFLRVATVSGNSFSLGTALSLVSNTDVSGASTSLIKITNTTFLFSYSRYTAGTTPYVVYSVVITVSGTTVSAGTPLSVYSASPAFGCYMNSVMITATTAMLFFTVAGNSARCVIISISGTTLTAGTIVAFPSSWTSTTYGLCVLSPTKVLCLLHANGGEGFIATVSGTSISISAYTTLVAEMQTASLFTITPNLALAVYSQTFPYAVLIDISPTDVMTAGTPVQLSTTYYNQGTGGNYAPVAKFSNSQFVVTGSCSTNNFFYAVSFGLLGRTIRLGTQIAIDTTAGSDTNGTIDIAQVAGGIGAILWKRMGVLNLMQTVIR
jgi:hypothetical protein